MHFPSSNASFLFLAHDKAFWKLEAKICFHIQMLFASSHWLFIAGFAEGEWEMHACNFVTAGTVFVGEIFNDTSKEIKEQKCLPSLVPSNNVIA